MFFTTQRTKSFFWIFLSFAPHDQQTIALCTSTHKVLKQERWLTITLLLNMQRWISIFLEYWREFAATPLRSGYFVILTSDFHFFDDDLFLKLAAWEYGFLRTMGSSCSLSDLNGETADGCQSGTVPFKRSQRQLEMRSALLPETWMRRLHQRVSKAQDYSVLFSLGTW